MLLVRDAVYLDLQNVRPKASKRRLEAYTSSPRLESDASKSLRASQQLVLPSADPRDEAHIRIRLDDVVSRRRGWWVGGHGNSHVSRG